MHRPRIRHNTYKIKQANLAACELFRCEEAWLIGQELPALIIGSDMQALAKLRLGHIRQRGELHDQLLPLRRADGSSFWASVRTYILEAGKLYETLVIFEYERTDPIGTDPDAASAE